jgi:alanyl-tRNA synthetase
MIAGERRQSVDGEGFETALAEQRRQSRAARKAAVEGGERRRRGGEWIEVKRKGKQKWIGYETTKADTEPLAFRQTGDQLELILEENPFYAESGGQVSDTGVVSGDGWELTVEGVEKVDGKSAVVGTFGEPFEPTAAFAQVNEARRHNIERNHTATHLVHAALRKMLGTHVHQAGSVVAPERLRFDFSHHGPIKGEQLAAIEAEVNAHVWENLPIETRQMAYKDAVAAGAMALCGGTHVGSTGQIALFRFTHETGAAAGVRRIEALTGPAAYRYAIDLQNRLSEAAGLLKTQPEHLARRIEAMLEENRRLEKRVQELLRGGAASGEQGTVQKIGDVELYIGDSDIEDRNQIAVLMDGFRAKHKQAISVLFTTGERAGIHVAVTDDLVSKGVKAGDIVNAIASATGGKGGGRPHFASAGVGDVSKLGQARARTPDIVRDFAR